jgi:hypothetical protein
MLTIFRRDASARSASGLSFAALPCNPFSIGWRYLMCT